MAIEPLSSAMTYQAQTTQQARPVPKVAEDMDVAAQEQNNIYDSTTVKVAAPEKREEQSGGQSGSEGGNTPKEQQQASTEQIKKAVEQLNKNLSHSEAVFGIHDATNRVTIKIVDKESKEVIKEIPPEKTLDMIAKAWELAGLLVDERR
ncbi:MAG: flagellar protein FlaG [Lachnospiraceae bacterium]|nr:flagellar protein FlaG [Lachnospiraceae bacterium]MDE7332496.1 flagellar protein FlaG [Lachnospiraceae bacterium]